MKDVPQAKEQSTSQGLSVPLRELIMCVSSAMDLMCNDVAEHNKRVAFIAAAIGRELGLPPKQINDLLIAGALHDIGAFSLQERLDTLRFEEDCPTGHAAAGAQLLQTFGPFRRMADMVRFHHAPWKNGRAQEERDVPLESFVLHLSDRVEVQLRSADTVLEDAAGIMQRIGRGSGSLFHPDSVEAFRALSDRESFWLSIASPSIEHLLEREVAAIPDVLATKGLMDFGLLVTRLIDFRSRFTSVHSRGVAATAEVMADLAGFSGHDQRLMRLAGYFHDLGKLVVPSEIIEKPAALSRSERNNVKRHTFYTYQILEDIEGFEIVRTWAALHHERLDGSGYPFRYHEKEIPQGSRIMAVADVFTALTEDRPYRTGMNSRDCLTLMREMAATRHLDETLVSLAHRHADALNDVRQHVQDEALEEYAEFAMATEPRK